MGSREEPLGRRTGSRGWREGEGEGVWEKRERERGREREAAQPLRFRLSPLGSVARGAAGADRGGRDGGGSGSSPL